jgi:hypothetical protein
MKTKILFVILAAFALSIISCNSCSKDTGEKFIVIPYGSKLKDAKKIFNNNNMQVTEEEPVSKDNRAIKVFKLDGSFYDESCEINFVYIDGIFHNGAYRFVTDSRERLEEIRDKLVESLSAEFNQEAVIDNELFYKWEAENKIHVTLMYIDSIDSITVIYYGTEYIRSKK